MCSHEQILGLDFREVFEEIQLLELVSVGLFWIYRSGIGL